jgi:hypothetical protein
MCWNPGVVGVAYCLSDAQFVSVSFRQKYYHVSEWQSDRVIIQHSGRNMTMYVILNKSDWAIVYLILSSWVYHIVIYKHSRTRVVKVADCLSDTQFIREITHAERLSGIGVPEKSEWPSINWIPNTRVVSVSFKIEYCESRYRCNIRCWVSELDHSGWHIILHWNTGIIGVFDIVFDIQWVMVRMRLKSYHIVK